jgi:formylglycine-generating enzyme required for sulfatase activity
VVSFTSDPAGALVEIDGRPVGETPCTRPLAAGLYEVAFKKVRYVPHSTLLQVEAGMAPVAATLTPDFGWLTVISEPPGLSVTIDGREAGVTPLRSLEVDTGAHDVLVVSPVHHEEGRRVVIERGERETVSVEPVPRNGGLKVLAVDPDGDAVAGRVLVGGEDVGTTYEPITVLMGRHEVQVRSDAGSWAGEVTVVERELITVEATVKATVAAPVAGVAGLRMVPISAGSFTMGSPPGESGRDDDEKQHRVTLTRGFLMSATEVTQAQYEAVMGESPSHFEGASRPVESVSWYDAVRFCNALSEREGLRPAYRIAGDRVTWDRDADGYRLPTEAEWEYACRAGTTTRFHTGDGEADLDRAGWYSGNSGRETHDVGQKAANAWGLYDMHGNVWEWCWDWYDSYGGDATDPAGPSGPGDYRVLRGGYWYNYAQDCRSANRYDFNPDSSFFYVGFRPVRSTP